MTRFMVLLLSLVTLVFLPAMQCGALTAPIVYVAGDGSGDYTCDGTADQVEINEALKFVNDNSEYTTVYLKGPFTYDIADTVNIGSDTILTGDDTVVFLSSTQKDIINGTANSKNITIQGFTIDGNFMGGSGINLSSAWRNANINNMNIDNIGNSGSRKYGIVIAGSGSKDLANIKIYNNKFTECTFDSIDMSNVTGVEIYGNNILAGLTAYPTGMRFYQVNNLKIHDNVIRMQAAGYPALQIYNYLQNNVTLDNIEIYNNEFVDIRGAGVLVFAGRNDGKTNDKSLATGLHIHHNVFRNTGTHASTTQAGGIVLSGFDGSIIEHNVFDGCRGVAVTAFAISAYIAPPQPEPYVTYVRNNIFVNGVAHNSVGAGHAISNRLADTHIFVIDNNCVYNNASDDYVDVTPNSSISDDPLFADPANFDYHLKSEAGRWDGTTWVIDGEHSPCIDAGYLDSDFANEPAPNGNRVNIGLYGNTEYASKSVQ
jgi:hypothetical protein